MADADVELSFSVGELQFSARGPKEWVDDRFADILRRFGDRQTKTKPKARNKKADGDSAGVGTDELGPKATRWIKTNNISQEALDHAFHVEDDAVTVVVPEPIGSSTKERALSTYLLLGAAMMLQNDASSFTDKTARALCSDLGCYDKANHAKHMRDLRTLGVTGSKGAGWKLTTPGLNQVATLIKNAATPAE